MYEVDHYCAVCGRKLKATRRIYDVEFATVEVDEFDVERCPDCFTEWIDVEDELPNNNGDYVIGWSGIIGDLPFECWYSKMFECWYRGDDIVRVEFWKRYSM